MARGRGEDAVKVMVVSEFPVDSVIGTSPVSQLARKGILEYASLEKPDVIFVDGLITSQRDPEVLVKEVRERETLEGRIAGSMELAAEFLKELRAASPSSQIYLAKTDGDEYNCNQLDKLLAKEKRVESEGKGSVLEAELKALDAAIHEAREKGQRKKLMTLAGQKGAVSRRLRKMEGTGQYRQPIRGSAERVETKKEAFDRYYGGLERLVPGVIVSHEDRIHLKVRRSTIEYVHNAHSGPSVLSNRGSSALRQVKERLSAGEEVPDIIIEGGHHAESYVQPIRRKDKLNNPVDEYTLLVSSMVMEDQERVAAIATGTFERELFHGYASKLESVKRAAAKSPPAGIIMVGRDSEGFFKWSYPLNHLAAVGRGKEIPDEGEYGSIYVISDMHFGKGTTRYDLLRNLMDRIDDEIDERREAGASIPALFFLNEALQGYNYDTLPVELPIATPSQKRKSLEARVRQLSKEGLSQEQLTQAIIAEAVREHEGITMPRIEDQWKMYNEVMNRVIFKALLFATTDPAMIFVEGNHVTKSVGEKGITETGMQTVPLREVDRAISLLKDLGLANKDIGTFHDKVRVLEDGMISSYGAFAFKTGDQTYWMIAEHKPGSGTPKTNAVQKQMERAHHRADSFDFYFAGHQHYAAVADEGMQGSNDCRYIVKGGTFSEHDSYGKEGDWAPPTVGAVVVDIPENGDTKGPVKFRFQLSDILTRK